MTVRLIFAAGLALAVVLPAGAASAEQALSETRSVAVSTKDLDLASSDGVATLKRRVSNAVTRVCGRPAGSLLDGENIQRCRRSARADARSSVEIAVQRARTGVRYAAIGKDTTATTSN